MDTIQEAVSVVVVLEGSTVLQNCTISNCSVRETHPDFEEYLGLLSNQKATNTLVVVVPLLRHSRERDLCFRILAARVISRVTYHAA